MEKQIEEMAQTLVDTFNERRGRVNMKDLAESLHHAGYRKASDVAEEIYNELDGYSYPYAFGGWAISMDSVSYVLKKYLGKDLNVPTKESEGNR